MDSRMKLLCTVVLSMCLISAAIGEPYGAVESYQPSYQQPSYQPSYQPAYSPPPYYETYDTQVDYKESNLTRQCGILPKVHQQYGYDRSRVNFGQYPWQVGILDSYNSYLCAGALISPRHVITSSYCVDKLSEDQIRVRVGEFDLQSDRNYYEIYRNNEVTVCKKHPYYSVPSGYSPPQYGYQQNQPPQYDYSANYAVVILELSYDVDLDLFPQVEPVCLPELYYLTKAYTRENSYGYGYGGSSSPAPAQSQSSQERNEQGAAKDLECFVVGYQNSPLERIESQKQSVQPQQSYGYGYDSYKPSYESYYENSRTPRRAKVRKSVSYAQSYGSPSSYGYQKSYKTEDWEADYYYDACNADLGAPIFCLVEGPYEEENLRPQYPESYTPASYSPPAYVAPSYSPPSYSPPPYSPPSYSPPSYSPPPYSPPSYSPPQYSPPSYSPPSYEQQRYKRGLQQSQYSYQPSYAPPPSYQSPSYSSPPSYQPPSYTPSYEPEYKSPIAVAERRSKEYRRAALFGVVQYPPECSYGYGSESKRLTASPVEDIVPWIQNVIQTPGSCSSYSSYSSY